MHHDFERPDRAETPVPGYEIADYVLDTVARLACAPLSTRTSRRRRTVAGPTGAERSGAAGDEDRAGHVGDGTRYVVPICAIDHGTPQVRGCPRGSPRGHQPDRE